MRTICVALYTGMVLAVTATAHAQTGTQVWLAGRVILDVDSVSFSTGSTVPAGGVAFGVDRNRFGFQIALDVPASHTEDYVATYQDAGIGLVRTTVHSARSVPSWQAMAAFHLWTGTRVRVSLVAGLTDATLRTEPYTIVTERLGASGGVLERVETPVPGQSYRWLGIAFGVDVVIRLSSRVAVVAEVRCLSFPLSDNSGGIFRPAVGLRWSF